MARIKKANEKTKHDNKSLEDHITGKAEVQLDDGKYEVSQGEVTSDVRLEDDIGVGKGIIIRSFDFAANPEAFKRYTPSKQELFNAHMREIELFLWKDGYVLMKEVNPQLKLSKNRKYYRISVGAEPKLGEYIADQPMTLTDITHGNR